MLRYRHGNRITEYRFAFFSNWIIYYLFLQLAALYDLIILLLWFSLLISFFDISLFSVYTFHYSSNSTILYRLCIYTYTRYAYPFAFTSFYPTYLRLSERGCDARMTYLQQRRMQSGVQGSNININRRLSFSPPHYRVASLMLSVIDSRRHGRLNEAFNAIRKHDALSRPTIYRFHSIRQIAFYYIVRYEWEMQQFVVN